MHIVFYLGPSFEKWDPESIERHGSGASEWMAVEIARHLARRGHEVVVYADTPKRGTFDGVVYVPQGEFGSGPISDVLVAYRRPEVLDLSCLGHTDRLVFVTTDKHHEGAISDAQVAMTQRFVVVSEWHKRRFQLVHKNVPDRKLVVIPNGVRTRGAGKMFSKRTKPLIHTSSPDRGLEHAIRAMPAIRAEVPDAELHIYADFRVPVAFARQQQNAWRVEHLEKLEVEAANTEGVVFHGRVGRAEIEDALGDARVWVYPATVEETSCVAAMEAQVLCCRVVATRLGALEDTCGGYGCELIAPLGEAGLGEYVAAVVRALRSDFVAPIAYTEKRFSLEKALEAYEEVITGDKPTRSMASAMPDPGPALAIESARREAILLEQKLEAAPDDASLVLRLARAYRDGALISKARELFRRRAMMATGPTEEAHAAALEAARLTEKLTDNAEEIALAYELAKKLSPLRAVPRVTVLDRMRLVETWGWRLLMPNDNHARSLDDLLAPIAEALGKTAGKDGVPETGEIWFGVHDPRVPPPPVHAIIYQSEVSSSPWFTEGYRKRLARAREVWDYSRTNQAHYEARLKRHVPIRWSPCEEHGRALEAPPIDLGLIGSMCPRRAALRPDLRFFQNVVGGDRVKLERSIKVHVVPHFYEGAPVEQARISGLLASGHCVVAEEAPDQEDYPGPVYVPFDSLLEVARTFLENDIWRAQGLKAQEIFCRTTMVDSLVEAHKVYRKPLPKVTPELRLNLGACDEQSRMAGYVSVDIAKGADVQADLTKPWPWQTSTVDEILATDFIEHLPDKIFTMNEAYRVLKPGGLLRITVPTTDGRGAWQDPTHLSFWNRNSFWYFTAGDAHRERFGERYGIEARFRVVPKPVQHEWTTPEDISFLAIALEAVKLECDPVAYPPLSSIDAPKPPAYGDYVSSMQPDLHEVRRTLAEALMAPSAASIAGARGAPEIWAGSAPPKFVAMLRVKNEARWIGQVLEALRTVTDEIHVLDDHSTDDTRDIAQRMGAHVYSSFFNGLDETRDKNLLFDIIKAMHAEDLREDTRLWVIGIDGDEELEPGAAKLLRDCTDPRQVAYSFQVLYLWNKPDQVRVDGVYKNFRRFSMFRPVSPTLRFEGTPMHGNLHCKSIPEKLIASGKEHPLKLLHYGYLERNDRIAKYLRYNQLDPGNLAEDQYRHIVQGDGFVREAMNRVGLQVNVPAEQKLKWAGPLTLVPLEGVLGKTSE